MKSQLTRQFYFCLCLTTICLRITSAVAQTETFSDLDFDPEDWTPVIHIYDDTSPPSGPNQSGGAITQETSGGDPGAYSYSYIGLEPGRRISTSGIYIENTYDPSQQAISSLDYSFSVRHINAIGGTSTDAFPALLQDGRLYLGQVSNENFTGNSWQDKSWSGLTSDDFIAIDTVYTGATLRPDFSAFGAEIQFGYALTNRVIGGNTLLLGRGVDNWSVTADLASLADIEGDGVGIADLNFWSGGYGSSVDVQLTDGDFDRDGDGDGADFLRWQIERSNEIGGSSAASHVPEPTSIAVLAASLLCGGTYQWRRLACRFRVANLT